MPKPSKQETIVAFTQVYVPDPAAVGQCMADACAALAKRGHRVIVYTASRGYDDPSIKYPRREMLNGVDVRRLPFSSFGKTSIKVRLLAGIIFLAQCVMRAIFTRNLSAIFITTSPPMCAAAALMVSAIRRVPIKYWVMDINPDQMAALGRLSEKSFIYRAFESMNRAILSKATDIITLDRFMAERFNRKVDISNKLTVMPPWPHESHLESIPHEANPFRKQHGLDGKFVIMYSGNHAYTSPVSDVIEAALKLQDEKDLIFVFIGGGVKKKDVDDAINVRGAKNIMSLPYQPLDAIKYSLSAADVHVVSVDEMAVGIVHPCKIYGAMAVGRPIFLVAPMLCHASDLVAPEGIGWHIQAGDVEGAVRVIRTMLQTSREQRETMGAKARRIIDQRLGQAALEPRLVAAVERGL